MDLSVKYKKFHDTYAPTVLSQSITSTISNICDDFIMVAPTQNGLVNSNVNEFNTAASLSDDSGVPLTTNSSISSGDSYRLSTKLEIEVVESDGEVSQFDSLENCSESGMSAENFNTLKKGPLAPIDPPPEFQDSPQTTLMRSVSKNLSYLRRWSSHSSFIHTVNHEGIQISKIYAGTIADSCKTFENDDLLKSSGEYSINDSYARSKNIYSSDSIINSLADNLYDEPNDVLTCLLGNNTNINDFESSSQFQTMSVPHVEVNQTSCPHYQDHTKYFKVIRSKQDMKKSNQKFNISELSQINDHDFYYGIKRNAYQHHDNSLQRKIIYSPLNYSYHCHNSHHTAVNTSNRPNSRNSLNSRLSSSHNSLIASSANKPDDSIFITQAMSHDALLSHEITDFYNVPIDSDIYALPVDMIYSENECRSPRNVNINFSNKYPIIQQSKNSVQDIIKCNQYKSNRKTNRNKRKKFLEINSDSIKNHNHHKIFSKTKYRDSIENNDTESAIHRNEHIIQEPLHMSLDEVKKFYHAIYSNTKITPVTQIRQIKKKSFTDSKDTISSLSSTNSGSNLSMTREKNSLHMEISLDEDHKVSSENDNVNNNVNIGKNQYNQQNIRPQNYLLDLDETNQLSALQLSSQYNVNNKQTFQREKKSQFSLSLKQKFCSIFRFKKNYNRCRTNNSATIDNSQEQNWAGALSVEDKRNKFQSRALPPLPNKAAENLSEYENKENIKPDIRTFQFTSSIEKVKDYGWYWGPLSSEAAEKVLSNETDGSFIVRDSSDDHYIFSLSFKLNNCVRHVRIEQDQGTFSFGSYAKFKSQTITEFIEKAVEHSRSGRYLFFLHRRPEHGPMRVQLTNPVSRFKHVQSLQHMCRFVILKAVIRKDLIQTLPLPRRLLDYLNYKHCFSEQVEIENLHSQSSEDGSV